MSVKLLFRLRDLQSLTHFRDSPRNKILFFIINCFSSAVESKHLPTPLAGTLPLNYVNTQGIN